MTIKELLGKIGTETKKPKTQKKKASVKSNALRKTGFDYDISIVNFAQDLGVTVSAASLLRRKQEEKFLGFIRMDKAYAELDEQTVAIENKASMTIGEMIQEHVNNEVSWSDIAKKAGITEDELTTMRRSFLWQSAALRAMPSLTIEECPTDEYYQIAIDYGVINPKGIE